MKTILIDALDTFIIEDSGIFQEMYILLETYKNPKLILTNADDEQLVTFGLVDLPYDLFTLKHKPNKTNVQYFEKMLAHHNLTNEDVIYFEHDEEAVKIAQSMGITTYHYNQETKDLDSLKTFLDKNS